MQAFVDRFRAKAVQGRPGPVAPEDAAEAAAHSRPSRSGSRPSPCPPRARRWPRRCCGWRARRSGYDGKPILRKLNLRLDIDDRIGLLGVNGAGKSTFAKLIAGALRAHGAASCTATGA